MVKYYHPMPRISGILRFVSDLIESLAGDFSIRVFTYRFNAQALPREKQRGYEIVRLKAPFPLQAGHAVKSFRPDAVIFGSGFWRSYFLLPYWEIFRAGLGRFRGPVILTQYTNMNRKFPGLLKILFPPPGLVITTNESMKGFWERFHPGKVRCLPPGLKIVRGEKEVAAIPAKKRKVRIGYFGHFQRHKGPDILLELFQQINPVDAELLLHGEGKMVDSLKERARGWENVVFQGYVPEIRPWLHSCDFIVLPYRSAVSVLGYSRVALEALAGGIPVVTTLNPAVAPLIENGKNGFVCRDKTELKEKIQSLIENQALREKFSAGAVQSGSCFNITRVAEQYKQLILETIKNVTKADIHKFRRNL